MLQNVKIKKILISEDNISKYKKIANVINEFDPEIEITHKNNVEDTLSELMTESKYDFLFQDIQLPEKSNDQNVNVRGGLLVAQYIRDNNIELPYSFFSSNDVPFVRSIAANAGLNDVKSIEFDSFSMKWKNSVLNLLNSTVTL